MSDETPVQGTAAAARRRRLRARGQIARKPPPTTDEKPQAWPKRLAILLLLGGVGFAGWTQRSRVASLLGSARARVESLANGLMADDPPEFSEGMEIDLPDDFVEVTPPLTEPPPDWTDPDSVPDELAPLPGPPPGYDPTPAASDPVTVEPSPPPPTRKPPPTRVARADPTPTMAPAPTEPAGPGWRARAGDLWTKTKRGWTSLRAKLDVGADKAQEQWAKLMGEPAPTPEPSPSLAPIDPNYDPFAIGATPPKPTASPTSEASPEPTQVAVVDPLTVVRGPDWVPPEDPTPQATPEDRTPLATTDPWASIPTRAPKPTRRPTPTTPDPTASSWTARLAGADGQRMDLPSGVRLDLHPYSRYRKVGDEVVLLSGGALVRLPAEGGSLRLSGGLLLRGSDQLFEVDGVESAGSVDALTAGLVLERTGRTPETMKAMERRYIDEDLAEPVPLAQAGTFVRRLAWFDAHPRRERAATRALELAKDVLEATRGTSREMAAREAVGAAVAWAERVAMRHQREATARL